MVANFESVIEIERCTKSTRRPIAGLYNVDILSENQLPRTKPERL